MHEFTVHARTSPQALQNLKILPSFKDKVKSPLSNYSVDKGFAILGS